MTSPLHDQPLLPHLIVRSLGAHDDAPCIHLAGRVATYAEIRRRTSQLIQAQRARGVTLGTRLAVLSKNRPEVLTNLTASLVNGCVLTPLPPGPLADHAYVKSTPDRMPRVLRDNFPIGPPISRRGTRLSAARFGPKTPATTTLRR